MRVKDTGKVVIVHVEDNLDQSNCLELQSRVISLIAHGRRDIVINLAGARYVNSAGIGVLVFISNLLKRYNRKLKLTALQPNVAAIIKTTHLDEMWEVYEDLDQAVASLGS
jgi:anti-sigma B factor antagonist